MEYDSDSKKKKTKNEIPFVATWMEPESIMLSGRSQTEKDKNLHWNLKK